LSDPSLHFLSETVNPIRLIGTNPEPLSYPEIYQDLISIDVIHDGQYIPAEFQVDRFGKPLTREEVQKSFSKERDWGANLVACRIAKRLGLKDILSINTARCLIDFGRFPGSTRDGASHLGRFAINQPFSGRLGFNQKRQLLANYYDRISDEMERRLSGKLIKIAIHTYDRYNPSGTERPHVSLVTRTLGYQMESKMPFGVFDPLYPDILAEFTVDRVLRDRISLTLEKNSIPVAHNYPYLLPEGSTEVRHQVWRFFNWLQIRFQKENPESIANDAYCRVWGMLKDTNLRSAKAGELRSVLHMYRQPDVNEVEFFERIIDAYRHIHKFANKDGGSIIHQYRRSPMRCMSLGIEVRKDLVWDFDENGVPVQPNPKQAYKIADSIAEAMSTYLNLDRTEMGRLPQQ
jgi:hypothetical protein